MKVVSLFCGAGGLDLGFIEAGSEILWANDIEPDCARTYRHNCGKEVVVKDVKDVKGEEVPNSDIIIGGFPCLGFTIARGKARTVLDEKNFLYLEFLRIVTCKKPSYFLIENVPGMAKGMEFEKLFGKILKDFSDAGYEVDHKQLDAVEYGVPQFRKRIFILGTRKGVIKRIAYPEPTHSRTPSHSLSGQPLMSWVRIKEAIGDLPEPSTDTSIPNHYGTRHKVKINNYMGNRPLEWNSPSPTITGRGSRTGGPVIHPHPNLHRRLTVRECARLQSFPDTFVFFGSPSSQYAQVGNAVPPLLAFRVAQKIMKCVGEKPRTFDPKQWLLPWSRKVPET